MTLNENEKFQTMIAKIRANYSDDTWRRIQEERAVAVDKFCQERFTEYATALNLEINDVFNAIEARRDYCAVNYYQDANFPSLKDVQIFDSEDAFFDAFPKDKTKFQCPYCNGLSSNPYTCNSGILVELIGGSGSKKKKGKEVCNWKVGGLFRDLGKGMRLTFKNNFLEHGRIETIFQPVRIDR